MKFISNWKQSWRMFSQQAMFAIAIIQIMAQTGVLESMFTQLVTMLPTDTMVSGSALARWVSNVTIAIAVIGMYGRIVAQWRLAEASAKEAAIAAATVEPAP